MKREPITVLPELAWVAWCIIGLLVCVAAAFVGVAYADGGGWL